MGGVFRGDGVFFGGGGKGSQDLPRGARVPWRFFGCNPKPNCVLALCHFFFRSEQKSKKTQHGAAIGGGGGRAEVWGCGAWGASRSLTDDGGTVVAHDAHCGKGEREKRIGVQGAWSVLC